VNTVESVEALWQFRMEIAQRRKRRRLARFYRIFLELIRDVAAGKTYTLEQMRGSPWWRHLRPMYRSWSDNPLSEKAVRQLQQRFQDSIDLFHDVREHGVRDPLEMFWADGGRYLILGYRRLVICHVLGVETVDVLTHPDYDTYRRCRGEL
jgi:hypothetical protein